MGWNGKERRGYKDFKKGAKLGGCLKKGVLEPSYELFLSALDVKSL